MNIHGRQVVLRAPEMNDKELLYKWANDPDIWKLLGGWHFPYASLSTEKWISGANSNNHRDHVFCIVAPEIGLIGTANLLEIDWKNRHAEHGMMLGDRQNRGKGYGLDTVMALMRYAFEELGLVRLDSGMVESNERSIHFYTESCGWEIEGRKKNFYYRSGRYFDQVIVGITRENYDALVQRTRYWEQ